MRKPRKNYTAQEKVSFSNDTLLTRYQYPTYVTNTPYNRQSSIVGKRSFSKIEHPLSKKTMPARKRRK